MRPARRVHAGERLGKRDAQLEAQPDHILLVTRRERRDQGERRRQADRERAAHGLEELRRGVGEGIVRERAQRQPRDVQPRAEHGGLRHEHDVASRQVHVLVRRVVPGWLAGDRPVRGGVDVAHVDRQRGERRDAAGERRVRQQAPDGVGFRGFPGETGAHEDRLHAIGGAFLEREQHGAVEASRQQHR